jgi:hypothetical protein
LNRSLPTFTTVVVVLAVAAGAWLRLSHPNDIEYKADERYTFEAVQSVLYGRPWPALGMPMSVGAPNPGMSVWIFVALGAVARAVTPPDLARGVQALNVAAIGGLIVLAMSAIPAARREVWLWAAALWSVNPPAIMLERKIWAQSVLPIFAIAMVASWLYRRKGLGSFLLGVSVAAAGQIHMTGALFGLGLIGWTAIGDRRSFKWIPLAAGVAVALAPALPWAAALWHQRPALYAWRWPFGSFYKFWFLRADGFGADFSLGPADYARFLEWPIAGGRATSAMLAIHALMAVVGGLVLAIGARRALTDRRWSIARALAGSTDEGRIVRGAFFGFGGLLTALTIRGAGLFTHYLEVIAPVLALWVAASAAYGDGDAMSDRTRRPLAVLCLCGGLIAATLLSYVHVTGDIHGEFGRSWAAQQRSPGG